MVRVEVKAGGPGPQGRQVPLPGGPVTLLGDEGFPPARALAFTFSTTSGQAAIVCAW
jgi:hypothetical protein